MGCHTLGAVLPPAACVAGQGRVNALTSSVSIGATCPPTQRDLPGPPPHNPTYCTTVEAHGHHSPLPICLLSIPSDGLYLYASSPFSRAGSPSILPKPPYTSQRSPAEKGSMPMCPHDQRGAGARIPTPIP